MKPFIDQIVLKICSRCNINCSYCYMYNMGDESYTTQPKFFSLELAEILAQKIKKHCKDHNQKKFSITLHGGEPLLYGKKRFIQLIKIFKSIEDNQLKIEIGLQSNGLLLDEEWCDLFLQNNINIGISLDGIESVNDAYRIDFKGKGTYHKVLEAIELCKTKKISFGILSVVNTSQTPKQTLDHFMDLKIPGFDLLLLDENHDTVNPNNASIGNWLIELFDLWFPKRNQIAVTLFSNIINGIYGFDIKADSIGKEVNKTIIIETNGSIETLDVLKICGEGFTKNPFSIQKNEFDEIFASDLIQLYYYSNVYLPKKCLACPVQDICAGGYIPHRYSKVNGFDNPTIYCEDYMKFISHVQNKLLTEMDALIVEKSGIEKLTVQDITNEIEKNINLIEDLHYQSFLKSFRKTDYVLA